MSPAERELSLGRHSVEQRSALHVDRHPCSDVVDEPLERLGRDVTDRHVHVRLEDEPAVLSAGLERTAFVPRRRRPPDRDRVVLVVPAFDGETNTLCDRATDEVAVRHRRQNGDRGRFRVSD